jgi:hypothetical protein
LKPERGLEPLTYRLQDESEAPAESPKLPENTENSPDGGDSLTPKKWWPASPARTSSSTCSQAMISICPLRAASSSRTAGCPGVRRLRRAGCWRQGRATSLCGATRLMHDARRKLRRVALAEHVARLGMAERHETQVDPRGLFDQCTIIAARMARAKPIQQIAVDLHSRCGHQRSVGRAGASGSGCTVWSATDARRPGAVYTFPGKRRSPPRACRRPPEGGEHAC